MENTPLRTVTFLFTDLEGSTRLWEQFPEAMQSALARHDALLREAVTGHNGHVVKTTGDGVHAAFATARDAVDAAVDAQRALGSVEFGAIGELRVRMGLHTGTSEARDGDYYGSAVNRAARIMAVAHGKQIVCSQATADLVREELPHGATLLDLGEHRLRDLTAIERVFQIAADGLPADFPPLRSLGAYSSNLPLQVSAFVGRDDDLARVADLLSRERLVTITGPGGVGKTRLALQTAAATLPDYPDGSWFVDLAPVGDAEYLASEIGAAMGLPESRTGTPEDGLVRALAHRDTLVVLDNCEHVVDAVARLADIVIRRCAAVTVLATSQEALGVDGEVTHTLKPLPEDDAVSLFATRAAAARQGFVIDTGNRQTVTELCRRLDGIPLAIELASARVASMSPAAVLERVDERFRLLAQGRRTARTRHQTLRATVEWSYGLLEPDEQRVFDRLSVFVGDFTLDAAEGVAGDETLDALDVLDILSGLVAKSMVQLDDASTDDRYRLLETMRDFGQQQLAERGELEAIEARHAEYYLAFATLAGAHLHGADDARWMARINHSYANMRVALAFLRDRGDGGDFAQLVFALAHGWRNVDQQREALAWIDSALEVDYDLPPDQRAQILAVAAQMAVNQARYDEAFDYVERSLACTAAAGLPSRPLALVALGNAALVQNQPEEARHKADQAVACARTIGDPYELTEALAQGSHFYSLTVDDARGAELADESLERARELGNSYLLSLARESSGIARYRTDPARAIAELQASIDTGTRNRMVTAQSRFIKAVAHLALRQYDEAAGELCRALPLMQEGGEPYYQSMALALAAAVLARPLPDVAVRLLALVDRLRTEGVFEGAPRDLETQARLRERLEQRLGPAPFEARWTEGRALTLDGAVAVALDELAVIANAQSR